MGNNQAILKSLQESRNRAIFKEGLNCFISGGLHCFSEMQNCQIESPEGQKEVFGLSQKLKKNIDLLCTVYLDWVNRQAGDSPLDILVSQKIITGEVQDHIDRIECELSRERRRNRKIMKENLKLKKSLRRVSTSLGRLRESVRLEIASPSSKVHESNKAKLKAYNTALVKMEKEISESVEKMFEKSLNLLLAKFQEYTTTITKQIREKSAQVSTKIDQLESNLTKKISETPGKVIENLNKNHRKTQTPKFLKIEDALLSSSKKEMAKLSKSTNEKIDTVFESLMKKLQEILG